MKLAWSCLLLLFLAPTWSGPARRDQLGAVARMAATPLPIRAGSGDRRVGALRYVRGYRLTSPDPAFGGFSSMMIVDGRFTLLSDGGDLVSFSLDAAGHVGAPRFAGLPAGPGTGWLKEDRDSESLTRDAATGRLWVGFEQWNAIWRYAPGFARAERAARPRAMRRWPSNGGPEAMLRLGDGRFMVLSEQQPGAQGRGRAGLIFPGDPTLPGARPLRFTYLPPADYEPTDAVQWPDGRILILNRRFALPDGFTAVLTVIDPRALQPGARVEGRVVARFAGDVLHDNFEALAVEPRSGRAPLLWIASDDNQNAIQQSLLLAFEWNGDTERR